MAHWKTEQYAEHLKKSYQSYKINCTFDDCPRFNNGCNVVPSQGILFGNTKAKLFFVTDLTSQDESDLRMPAVQPAGRLLREAMISHVLVQKKLPFLITKLFRSYIGEGKQPKVFESKLCFSHFHKELKSHQPELLVSLGINVFNTLYNFAVNKSDLPPKDEHTIIKLRGKFFDFIFEDNIKVKVVITHSPGFVMQTPVLYKLFKEDAQVVANYCSTGSESIEKTSFEIKRIDRIETAKDIFDYLDFLHRGLPKPTVVAFDTETINLNRRFNNRFLTWQFSHEEGVGVSFPILHKDRPLFADPKLRQELIVRTNALFNSTSKDTKINWFVGHNIKFDLSVLWGLMGILPKDPRVNVPWWCTMLAAHWLDENRKGLRGFLSGSPFSLKTFGVEYFNFYFEEEALERRGDGALEELTLDQLYTYGGSDAALTRAIAYHQINVLAKAEPDDGANKLKKFAKNYYFPASRALAVLECNGIYVRQDHLAYLQGEDSPVWARMSTIEHKMQNLPDVLAFRDQYKDRIGGKVKNASNFEQDLWNFEDRSLPKLDLNKQDVQRYFYLDFLKLNPLKRSKKTGEPTLNSMFLNFYAKPTVFKETPKIKEKFCDYYGNPMGADEKDGTPLYNENALQLEAEYRKLKKLGTAYLDGIEGYLRNPKGDCIDSRVRASYNAHGTDTGRLSSQNPNLQQLPGRDKVAKSVKNMFQAEPPSEKFPEGTVLIQGDYKTAEVRWAALFSQDKNLISIFQESSRLIGEAISDASVTDQDFEKANLLADLHRRTASLMFGKPADQINKTERQNSKSITFGLMFGMAVKTLAENNGWTLEEGEDKLEKYFSAFPQLESWLKKIPDTAKRKGYVETFMGRRRRLKHLLEMGKLADSWKHLTEGERKAMNASIQGQSSDAGTIGMFMFLQYIFDNGLEERWLVENVVHDSCLVQVPYNDLKTALNVMKKCFVKDMQSYIEKNWDCEINVDIEMEFEIGLTYGGLTPWDGREKTLDAIVDKLDAEKVETWKKTEAPAKPPKALDLVKYFG